MSRIGKKPIPVAAGVDVTVNDSSIKIKGKNGELTHTWHPNMDVSWDAAGRVITVGRPDDLRQNRALHGLTRAIIANNVQGVQTPWEKRLEIQGVGYQATLQGKVLSLQVGYANIIKLPLPDGVICEVASPTLVIVRGADRHAVGQFAANVRRVRPPEPYKGKGIRYVGEVVRRKSGKAFGS
ncbi:50S ribosomal protein L6 [Planctomicrobium piriforme]|uniref:Large ribosomal subunit protein uL6 n=1 Tax=Planctomicrobium piriforme TaxID=1576369 RepID=A0A1I3C711_9PLAN|nr:50S ribosomal protein L6 [Planctomicrobium piriforme]SFH70290.1 large subunit ribosomal protein L6 [Planctomicrobium piriforme]